MQLLTLLLAALPLALALPSSVLEPRDEAPCDATTETCRDIMMAETCFASQVANGDPVAMLECIYIGNQARSKEAVSSRHVWPCHVDSDAVGRTKEAMEPSEAALAPVQDEDEATAD